MGNRPEWAVAWLAAGLVGAVLVPVNTFAPPERARLDAAPRRRLVAALPTGAGGPSLPRGPARAPPRDRARRRPGASAARRCPSCGARPVSASARRAAGSSRGRRCWRARRTSPRRCSTPSPPTSIPRTTRSIIYTSGTTERPKGILHAQRTPLLQSARFVEAMGLGPEDRVFTSQPFFWTAGIAMSLGASLAAGSLLVLQEVFEPGRALELLERERITTVHAWPHQEKALGEHPDAARRDLSSVAQDALQLAARPPRRPRRRTSGAWTPPTVSARPSRSPRRSPPTRPPSCARGAAAGRSPGLELRVVDPVSGRAARGGRARRDRGARHHPDARLLQARARARLRRRRLVPHPGRRLPRRRRSSPLDRPALEPDQDRRRQRLAPRDRGARCAPTRASVPRSSSACRTRASARSWCSARWRGRTRIPSTARRSAASCARRLAPYKVPRRVLFFRPDELAYTGNQKIQLGPLRERRARAPRGRRSGDRGAPLPRRAAPGLTASSGLRRIGRRAS